MPSFQVTKMASICSIIMRDVWLSNKKKRATVGKTIKMSKGNYYVRNKLQIAMKCWITYIVNFEWAECRRNPC